MKYANYKYNLFLATMFSILIFVYSELSILALIFFAIPLILKFNVQLKVLVTLFFLYTFILIGKIFDSFENILITILYTIIAVFMLSIFCKKRIEGIYLFKIANLSLFVVLMISLFFSNNFTNNTKLRFESINVKSTYKNNTFVLIANNERDSWGFFNLGFQGSGEIEAKLEIRSNIPRSVNVGLLHNDLPQIWNYNSCKIRLDWSTCGLKAKLSSRNVLTFGIGGWATWKSTDAAIEVRNPRVLIVKPPIWFEYFQFIQRFKGFSFNENAFGAQVAVASLLLIASNQPLAWSFFTVISAMLCILLTGSRGSLTAFAGGLLVFLLSSTRYYKILPFILSLVFLGILILQTDAIHSVSPSAPNRIQPILRSLDIVDQNSARIRLEIWRLAIKAWLENPRSFLIGTGNLTNAMKAQFDARSSNFGLSKDSLTHAHNLWIQTAGESGLVGLCAMLWLWGWVILRAWRLRDTGALALLTAIFAINSVDYLFFYAPVHLCFWIAAAGLKKIEAPSIITPIAYLGPA